MAGVGVELKGWTSFRNGLRRAGAGWTRALALANREIGQYVAKESKANTETAQQAKASRAIRGRGAALSAKVVILDNPPFALGAFLGALQYAQFPTWVGNSWDVGGPGGPYAVNPTIRANMDNIVNAYGDAFERISTAAFPDGLPKKKSRIFTGAGSF